MTITSEYELRVFSTELRGPVSPARPGHEKSELYWTLSAHAHEAFRPMGLGNHQLIRIPSTRPHTLRVHDVYWVVRKEFNGAIAPWTEESWNELAEDQDFLDGTQAFVTALRDRQTNLRAYMVIGFQDPDEDIDTTVMYSHGLQSQPYPHIHIVEPCDGDEHGWSLTPRNPAHLDYFRIFIDAAGEQSRRTYAEELSGFGRRFVYQQRVGQIGHYEQVLPRMMFGFTTFSEAFRETLALQKRISIEESWRPYIVELAKQQREFAGTTLNLLQSPVPSFAIILPSAEDRFLGSIETNDETWVMALTVVGPPNVLTRGGAFYRPNALSDGHHR